MRLLKKCVCSLLLLAAVAGLLPSAAYADDRFQEYEIVLEDEILQAADAGYYDIAPVDLRLAIHNAYASYGCLTLGFYEVKEHYVVELSFTDYQDVYQYKKYFPYGTYCLYYVEFDEPVLNMSYQMDPEAFMVTENGYSGNIWINVDYTQTIPVNVKHSLTINDGDGFRGYLNMTYYCRTDTFFSGQEKKALDQDPGNVERVRIRHVSEENPDVVTNEIPAGDVCISNINVYDMDKEPLNVYYNPEFVTVERGMAYDNEIYEDSIYVFRTGAELTEDQLEKIAESGYVLRPASEMDPYSESRNESFDLYKGRSEIFTVLDGDIPPGEPGYDLLSGMTETGSETKGETVSQEQTGTGSAEEIKDGFWQRKQVIIAVIVIAAGFTGIFIYACKKSYSM